MLNMELDNLLRQVQDGSLSVEDAKLQLKTFEDMGYAKLDLHREKRTGFPEVIFAQGKTTEQVVSIFERLTQKSSRVLATRVSDEQAAAVLAAVPTAAWHRIARVLSWSGDVSGVGSDGNGGPKTVGDVDNDATIKGEGDDARGAGSGPTAKNDGGTGAGAGTGGIADGYIAVVCAGTSDLPVAEEAALTAECIGHRVVRVYDVGVAGIHRLFHHLPTIQGASAVVVVAGMEGALASVVGGLVASPVIAVPTSVGYGASFGGVAALLTMLNSCAAGVTVVNIDNGFGAGYTAALINHASHRVR
jgi:NCAIR mutase (PurE)-related protein